MRFGDVGAALNASAAAPTPGRRDGDLAGTTPVTRDRKMPAATRYELAAVGAVDGDGRPRSSMGSVTPAGPRRPAVGLLEGLAERLHLVDQRRRRRRRARRGPSGSSACTDSSIVRATASSSRASSRRSRLSASPITRRAARRWPAGPGATPWSARVVDPVAHGRRSPRWRRSPGGWRRVEAAAGVDEVVAPSGDPPHLVDPRVGRPPISQSRSSGALSGRRRRHRGSGAWACRASLT